MLNNAVGGYTAANGAVGTTDLFRYSAYNTRSYTTAAGADPYFSIDSGATNLDYFNQSAIPNTDYGDWGNGITSPAPAIPRRKCRMRSEHPASRQASAQ